MNIKREVLEKSQELCVSSASAELYAYLKDHIAMFGNDDDAFRCLSLSGALMDASISVSGKVIQAGIEVCFIALRCPTESLEFYGFRVVSVMKIGMFYYKAVLLSDTAKRSEYAEAEFYGSYDLACLFDYMLNNIKSNKMAIVTSKKIINKMVKLELN